MSRAAALALALFVAAPGTHAQDIPVFASRVEVVSVDVSVMRDGKLIEGLLPGDFELRDNGVPQPVEIVGDARAAGRGKPVDVVLALDVSDSVRGQPLEQLKAAAHALVDVLQADDSFSLIVFSSRVRLAVAPADSRARAHEAIDATEAQLTTSLHDAAFAAIVTADPSRGRPLVLVLSDGKDQGSWLEPERVLRAAAGLEPVVSVVFTRREGFEPGFLRRLVATTGGQEWRADYGQLREVLLEALDEFRSRYTLRYERQGVARAGWHELKVRVRRPGARVHARSGYVAEESLGSGEP